MPAQAWMAIGVLMAPLVHASVRGEPPCWPVGELGQAQPTEAQLHQANRRLAAVYEQALAKAAQRERAALAMEQRKWLIAVRRRRGADEARVCVVQRYEWRTIELQTAWRLIPGAGPYVFRCEDGTTLNVTYFETTPASLLAAHEGKRALMRIAASASGARYVGRNESYWEHQGVVQASWKGGEWQSACRLR